MNAKEFQSAVIIKLDSCLGEMREIKRTAKALEIKVENIIPQSHLHPIPRPAQKEVGRDLNIAAWFRLKTKEENSRLPENAPRKYLEFPAHISDEQLNEDMKRCMYNIMCERLNPGWETKNWNMIYTSDKMLGEQIVKEAALRPEMAVIAQSSGYWAIRKVAEQRQKSTKRSAEKRNARVRVKQENKGSFGFRHRVFKEQHEDRNYVNKCDDASMTEPDETKLIAETNEDEVVAHDEASNIQRTEQEQKKSVKVPSTCMEGEAVSVVEDLESEGSRDEYDLQETKGHDEISSYSSGEDKNSVVHGKLNRDDHSEGNGKSQHLNDNVALLLKSLTAEQIGAIIAQAVPKPTDDKNAQTPRARTSSSNKKRNRQGTDVIEVNAKDEKNQKLTGRRTEKSRRIITNSVEQKAGKRSQKSKKARS